MKDTIYNFSLLFTMLTVASQQALKQAKLATRERASKQRRRERQRKGKLSLLSTPLALASPSACCSHVTSPDSSKWRACSQAMLTVQDGSTCNFCIL